MKKLLYVLTGLCLLAGVFTGCEDPLKDPDDPNGSGVSGGDGTMTIEGVVTSKDKGKPVLLASVTLLPVDKMTVTDTAGAFRFRDITAGTYRLQVKRTGYAPYTSGDIKVAAGKTVQYNIELAAEQSDLQIQNTSGEVIDELSIENDETQGVFVLKNTGTKIIEWEIPTLAVDWISDFSKQSGKLAPGASERVEFSIDRSQLSDGLHETILYIGSSVGDKELLLKVDVRSICFTDEAGEEISELYIDNEIQKSFRIKNIGNVVLRWEISDINVDWLHTYDYNYAYRTLEPGSTATVTLLVDKSKASEGTNEGIVHISFSGGGEQLPVRCLVEKGSDYVETASGMELAMVAVEGGLFTMGATEEQGSDAEDVEKPAHFVLLDDFYIGKYEVTQAQWTAVMGTNPPTSFDEGLGDNYPVYNVSWNEAVQFCEKLSQMTGKTYRLPTEAEWEYAARGGNKSQHYKYAGSNDIGEVAWYSDNTYHKTHPVGTKKANELGIYDMSGNAKEWCSDRYEEDYYSSSPVVAPGGPSSGYRRVLRGGDRGFSARYCRVSYRSGTGPNNNYNFNYGFRVACSAE